MHPDDGGCRYDESDARSIEFVNVFRNTARRSIQVDARARHSEQLRRRRPADGERLVEIVVEPDVQGHVVALDPHPGVLQASELGVARAETDERLDRPERGLET